MYNRVRIILYIVRNDMIPMRILFPFAVSPAHEHVRELGVTYQSADEIGLLIAYNMQQRI